MALLRMLVCCAAACPALQISNYCGARLHRRRCRMVLRAI